MSLGLLTIAALAAVAAQPDDRAIGESVSYVFASELGSGVYELSGRTLQVYRIPMAYALVPVRDGAPGVRLIAPATIGFFDFEPRDVLESGLPSRVDSFSLTPGLELEYHLHDDWRVIPYGRFGVTIASSSVDGLLYAAGVRIERALALGASNLLWRSELTLARVDFRHDVPDESYARARSAVETRRVTPWKWGTRHAEIAAYGIFDVLLDPPIAPVVGAESETLQFEFGVMLGARPEWRMRRVPLPRLGLGYRFAGELSGVRLVIGAPF